MDYKILVNQIRCNKCGDSPYSSYRHDYKSCECGAVAVDGGCSYLKRSFKGEDSYEEMSISVEDNFLENLKDMSKWARETGRNDFGIICAIFRCIRDNGYEVKLKGEEDGHTEN